MGYDSMNGSVKESLSTLLKRGLEKLTPSALKTGPIENPAQPLERSKTDAVRPREDRSTIAAPIAVHSARGEQRDLLPDRPRVSTIEGSAGAVSAADSVSPADERLSGAENPLSRSARVPDPRLDSQPQEPEPYGPFTLRPFKAEDKATDSVSPAAEISRFELFLAKPVDEQASAPSASGTSADFKGAPETSSSTDAPLSESPGSKLVSATQVATPDPAGAQITDATRSPEEKKDSTAKANVAHKANELEKIVYEEGPSGLAGTPHALPPSASELNPPADAIAGGQTTLQGETAGLDATPSLGAPQASALPHDIEDDQKNGEESTDRAEPKARSASARGIKGVEDPTAQLLYPENEAKNPEFSAQRTLEGLKSEPQTQTVQGDLRAVSADSEAFESAAFKASSAYFPSHESGTIGATAIEIEPENASKGALAARSGAIAPGAVDQASTAGRQPSAASDHPANAERTSRTSGLSPVENHTSRAPAEAASRLSPGVSHPDLRAQTEARGVAAPAAALIGEESPSPETLPGVPRAKELSRDTDSEKTQRTKVESSDSRPQREESRFQKPTETRIPDEARAVPAQQEGGTVAHVNFNVETAATPKTTDHASDGQAIERESQSHANNMRAGSRGPAAEETGPEADLILSDRAIAAKLFGQNLADVGLCDDRPLNNREEREMVADQWSSQNNPQRVDSPPNIDTVPDRKYEFSIDL